MIKQAEFIKSAADRSGWIDDEVSEICFVGRSNVGKSSFINSITNRHKLAKVANTPGKTRLLNFFDINKGYFRIVDAPGYGYAKINMKMKIKFGEMMEDYLLNRPNLKGVVMLVDLRHKPTADDKGMYNFLKECELPVLMIGTKLDKLKKNEIVKNEKMIKNELNFVDTDSFIRVSNLNKTNIDDTWVEFVKIIENNN